jgi:Uma2 family endonuclease
MGMAAPIYYSADMVRSLPEDGNRYETVHGELLVTPAPRPWHQVLVRRLIVALDQYLTAHPVGELLSSPADISWGPDILVQPDLFVVDLREARSLEWAKMKSLLFVVEVLSPSTTRFDRFAKRRLYQEVGIPVYWIVDPAQRAVEVWTPESELPTIERERVDWHPEGAEDAFVVHLEELFRPI